MVLTATTADLSLKITTIVTLLVLVNSPTPYIPACAIAAVFYFSVMPGADCISPIPANLADR